MLAPNFASNLTLTFGQDQVNSETREPSSYAIEAPKTPFLTLEEYAEIAANDAGIDPDKFKGLINCESVWHEDAAGDHGTSLGILQFKQPTFDRFSKKYNIEGNSLTNPYHQIDLAVLMIHDGYLNHWKNCGHHIGWLSY